MQNRELKKRLILVDDEPLAIQGLRQLIDPKPNLEIVATCGNGYEALEAIEKLNPDLLFLDIQMPGLSGFDVLDLLGKKAPPTIFVTAYDEFALKAFDANAVDYLLKPVHVKRLDQALERIKHFQASPLRKARQELIKKSGPLQRILIRTAAGAKLVNCTDITYIEAQDDFVDVHTATDHFLKYERLSRLELLLDPSIFVRVHRSYILNIQFLDQVKPYGSDSKLAYLNGGQAVPVSRAGYKKLRQVI